MILSPNAQISKLQSNHREDTSGRYTIKDVCMGEGYGHDEEQCALLKSTSEDDLAHGELPWAPISLLSLSWAKPYLFIRIIFKMVKKYRNTKHDDRTTGSHGSAAATDNSISLSLQKFSRFRVCFCKFNSNGALVRVSNFVTSLFIEDGTMSSNSSNH